MRAKHLKHLLLGGDCHSYLEQYLSPLFLCVLIFGANIDCFPTRGVLVATGLSDNSPAPSMASGGTAHPLLGLVCMLLPCMREQGHEDPGGHSSISVTSSVEPEACPAEPSLGLLGLCLHRRSQWMQRWKQSLCTVQPVSCAAEPWLPLIGLASPPAHKRSHNKAHLVSVLLGFHICILALFYISGNGLPQSFVQILSS